MKIRIRHGDYRADPDAPPDESQPSRLKAECAANPEPRLMAQIQAPAGEQSGDTARITPPAGSAPGSSRSARRRRREAPAMPESGPGQALTGLVWVGGARSHRRVRPTRWVRRRGPVCRFGPAVLAMTLVVLTAPPAATPAAAVTPAGAAPARARPLASQWWFTLWDIEKSVWPISQGHGVRVAVLDIGVQADLPGLSGRVLPGADFTGRSRDGRRDTDTSPVPGHGTAMANLIAGQGTGTGFMGVAPKATILPIVVHSGDSVAKAIRYATDHDAKIINVSQGSAAACPAPVQDAVAYAIKHDVVVVASAGDDGDVSNASEFPANCAGVLAVGATGFDGPNNVAWVSTQRHAYVAAAAPGQGVGSVLRDGRVHPSGGGTSQAAALTSAVAALVRARFPAMPARQIVQRLIASCRVVAPPGRDNATGYGLIRPFHALTDRVPASAPNPVMAAYDRWKATRATPAGASETTAAKPSAITTSTPALVAAALAAGLIIALITVSRALARSKKTNAAAAPPAHRHTPLPHGPPPPSPAPHHRPPPDGRPPFPPSGQQR